jgi:hypothetical protein
MTRTLVSKDTSTIHLQPIRTYNRDKVLIKDCDCKTLHSLSQTIVKNLNKLTLDQAQNQLEYEGKYDSRFFELYTSILIVFQILTQGCIFFK